MLPPSDSDEDSEEEAVKPKAKPTSAAKPPKPAVAPVTKKYVPMLLALPIELYIQCGRHAYCIDIAPVTVAAAVLDLQQKVHQFNAVKIVQLCLERMH